MLKSSSPIAPQTSPKIIRGHWTHDDFWPRVLGIGLMCGERNNSESCSRLQKAPHTGDIGGTIASVAFPSCLVFSAVVIFNSCISPPFKSRHPSSSEALTFARRRGSGCQPSSSQVVALTAPQLPDGVLSPETKRNGTKRMHAA